MAKEKEFDWNNMSIAELSKSYNDNDDDDKKIEIIKAIINKYNNEEDRDELSVYDLYAVAKAVQEATSIAVQEPTSIYNPNELNELENSIDNLKADISAKLDQENNSEIGLVKKLRMKTLHEAMLKLDETEQTKNSYDISKKELENAFMEEDPHLDNEIIRELNQADNSGALYDVDQEAIDNIRQAIAKFAGWDKIEGKNITEVNSVWAEILGDTDIKTNPNLYSKCTPEVVFTDEQGHPINDDETTKDLNNQLKVNAALNVAYDLLSDDTFIKEYMNINREDDSKVAEFKTAIQEKIGERYKRSLVLAKIATDETEDLLKNVSFNDGDIDINLEDTAFADIMNEINNNESIKLNPLTVAMDKYDLDNREAIITQSLKAKKIDPNKLPFLKRFQQSANKAWNVLSKKDTWKKIAGKTPRIALNVVIFGASTALMTGSTAAIATGAAMYAAWSVVNAKVMPIYDKAMNEIRKNDEWKNGNFSQKMKLLFKKEYYKNAKNAIKEQDKTEKKRQNTRALEGVIVGAAAGFGAFLGGSFGAKITRQGFMIAGKSFNLLQSNRDLNEAKKVYMDAGQRSVKNFQNIKAKEQLKKSDTVAFGTTLAATLGSSVLFNINSAQAQTTNGMANLGNTQTTDTLDVKTTDTLAIQTSVSDAVPEGIKLEDLSHDQQKMYLNSESKFGSDLLAEFHNASIHSSYVDTDKIVYIDKLARLIQLAPGEHKEAIAIMVNDLKCDTFTPSEQEIELVNTALNTITYENGTMEVVILDANGNPCVEEVSMFGQYTGKQQMVELDNGKQLPLRTANVTTKIGTEVNCGDGTATIKSIWTVNSIDCGCDKSEVVQEEAPTVEPEIIPEAKPIQFEKAYLQNDDELMLKGQTTAPHRIVVAASYDKMGGRDNYEIVVDDYESFLKNLHEPWLPSTKEVTDEVTGEKTIERGYWYTGTIIDEDGNSISNEGRDRGVEIKLTDAALEKLKNNEALISFSNPASLTTEQINALNSDKAEITYDPKNSDNRVDTFKVEGVDGVDIVSLPKATHIDLEQNPSFKLSSDQDVCLVTFYDAKGNEVYIEFDDKGCATVTDEKDNHVIIDKSQREQISNMISDMAKEQNITCTVNLDPQGVSGKLDDIRCSTTTAQQHTLKPALINNGKGR